MVKPEQLQCWKCGASLEYLLLPLSRTARCKSCDAAIHVCRMCRLYDPHVARSCREPVAPEVKDKQRANFCDYLELNPDAYVARDNTGQTAAQSQLNTLFGLPAGEENSSGADESRKKLEDLFGIKKEGN